MTEPERREVPDQLPFHEVVWKDSTAEVYNLDAILEESRQNEVRIYDRSDFQTPIERAQVSIKKVEVDGETCTEFTALIRLDRSRDDYIQKSSGLIPERGILMPFIRDNNLLSPRESKFLVYQNKDGSLLIEDTVFDNVYKVSHTSGTKVLVWVDSQKKLITVSNNLSLSSSRDNGVTSVSVRPPADGTIETLTALEGFLQTFMRTIDFTAGLTSYDPSTHKLKRTYAIGKERLLERQERNASSVGRTAVSRNAPGEENATDLPKDLIGVEVVDNQLSLEDIGGLDSVKRTLKDIAISFQHPEIMEKWGAKRPQGILLYGAPGTGKTMLAQALANEVGAEIWAIQSNDIYDRLLGDSERHLKEIFTKARTHKGRLILFFDEIDSILGITEGASSGADNARNSVAGLFKQEMNTLASENPNVLVIAATNNLDGINPALVRSGRFDHKVYVPMPDQSARQQIIANIVAGKIIHQESGEFKVFSDDLDCTELAIKTDGMSGADIAEIFRRLSLSRAMQEARTGKTQSPLAHNEIDKEIQEFRKS